MTARARVYPFVFFILTALAQPLILSGQNTIPATHGWRIHLPFLNNTTLCESGNKVYVGSQSGVFTFDQGDRSIEVISRISGLSSVEVKIIAADPATGLVFVIYEDANVDIIDGRNIYAINSIFNQSIIGKKEINNISFSDGTAYLACSFGVVLIDIANKRLSDSYSLNFGAGGTNTEINDIEIYKDHIYVATTSGMYRAPLNTNVSDPTKWSPIPSTGSTSMLSVFRNRLYAVMDSTLKTSSDGISFTNYPTLIKNASAMHIGHSKLIVVTSSKLYIEAQDGTMTETIINGLNDAIVGSNDALFGIGYNSGLVLLNPGGAIDYYGPPGPYGRTAQRFAYNPNDNTLWVAGGSLNGFGTSSGWGNGYNNNKFYRFTDNAWVSYYQSTHPKMVAARDFIDVSIHPTNNHVFLSTVGSGLFEIDNADPLSFTVYDTSNSSLGSFITGSNVFVSGTTFDDNGHLWVSNFGAINPLSVRTKEGTWLSFKLPNDIDGITTDPYVGYITVDDQNNKWILTTKGSGIIVYNDHNQPLNPSVHQVKRLKKDKQSGFLPSNVVFCMTKDHNGEMWVGTDQGLCIFSNTANIFKGGDYDAHQLVIKTGLVYSNFLGTGSIYCIRVDAANRKWIGTRNGVWLVSPDGYTVINNFNTGNSPLLSNTVYDIGINDKTGEVFFATEKGIISFMGTATTGGKGHGDVMVYPNPVKPDYHGLIAIRGLVDEANVKITDVGGNLVYETKANGGMATWNGLNMLGKRAATGVYLIYSTNQEATEQWVGKILFIN